VNGSPVNGICVNGSPVNGSLMNCWHMNISPVNGYTSNGSLVNGSHMNGLANRLSVSSLCEIFSWYFNKRRVCRCFYLY